jgi:hypothetical protein
MRNTKLFLKKEELVYLLSHLEAEGLQVLIKDYGTANVINNAEKLYVNSPKGQFSLLQVVRSVESNKEKRKILFEKMDGNASFVGDKINEADNLDHELSQENESIPKNYFENVYSSGDNFTHQSKGMINELKEQDNFFLNIYNLATLQTNFSVFPDLIKYLVNTDSKNKFIKEIDSLDSDTSIYDLTQLKFQEVLEEKKELNQESINLREKLQNKNQEDNNSVKDIMDKITALENSSFKGNPGSLNEDSD